MTGAFRAKGGNIEPDQFKAARAQFFRWRFSGKVFFANETVGGINQIAEAVQKKLKHCRYGSIGALSCQMS